MRLQSPLIEDVIPQIGGNRNNSLGFLECLILGILSGKQGKWAGTFAGCYVEEHDLQMGDGGIE